MFSKTNEITKKTALLFSTLMVAGLMTVQQAQAQEFPTPTKKIVTVEKTYNSSIPISPEMKKRMQPGIRYTVGSVQEKGWHKDLVKGNRNLGHYYWAPMNHMVQATTSNRTKVQYVKAPQKTRDFHYIKPVHAANPLNPHKLPEQRAIAHKAKYIHQNVPHNKRVAAAVRFPKGENNNQVSGQLISKATQAKVYADYSNKGAAASTRGYLTNKDAYGKILND